MVELAPRCCAYHSIGCSAPGGAEHETAAVAHHLSLLFAAFLQLSDKFAKFNVAPVTHETDQTKASVQNHSSSSTPCQCDPYLYKREPLRPTHLLESIPGVLQGSLPSEPTTAPAADATEFHSKMEENHSAAPTVLTSASSLFSHTKIPKSEETSPCTVDMFIPGALRNRSNDDTTRKSCSDTPHTGDGADAYRLVSTKDLSEDVKVSCGGSGSEINPDKPEQAASHEFHRVPSLLRKSTATLASEKCQADGRCNSNEVQYVESLSLCLADSQNLQTNSGDPPYGGEVGNPIEELGAVKLECDGVQANAEMTTPVDALACKTETIGQRDSKNSTPIDQIPAPTKMIRASMLLDSGPFGAVGSLNFIRREVEGCQTAVSAETVPKATTATTCEQDAIEVIPKPRQGSDSRLQQPTASHRKTSAKDESVSETGQHDLLRLLQGTQAGKDTARHDNAASSIEMSKVPVLASSLHSPRSVLRSQRSYSTHLATTLLDRSVATAPGEERLTPCSRSQSPLNSATLLEKNSINARVDNEVCVEPTSRYSNKVVAAADEPACLQDKQNTVSEPRIKQIETLPMGADFSIQLETKTLALDAQTALSMITTGLQEGRISHAEATLRFGMLIERLPPGKFRCCALLNRAHCLVALGRNVEALADVEVIVDDHSTLNADAVSWPKVWMSRGFILRKLAEDETGSAAVALYTRARQDFLQALSITGAHAVKARRCLDQLNELERRIFVDPVVHVIPDNECEPHHMGPRETHMKTPGPAQLAGRSPEKVSHVEGCLDASRSVRISSLPSDINVEQLWVEFQRFGSIEDVRIDQSSESSSRCGIICFSSLAEAEHAVQKGAEALCILCPTHSCTLELGSATSCIASTNEHSSKRRRLQTTVLESHSTNIDIHYAHKGLQVLGSECIKVGRSFFEECVVTSDEITDGSKAFKIKSSAGVEKVTLRPCNVSGGEKFGECTCRLHGHCKHVVVALLTIVAENDGKQQHSSTKKISSPSDPQARQHRDDIECNLRHRTIEELRHFLKTNDMPHNGTKPVIARRVADTTVFGTIPACPNCGGHLHASSAMDSPSSVYVCRKVTRGGKQCGYEVDGSELQRRPCLGGIALA